MQPRSETCLAVLAARELRVGKALTPLSDQYPVPQARRKGQSHCQAQGSLPRAYPWGHSQEMESAGASCNHPHH